jgi:ubiquinone/menaquinone biosynthesis C-methylase UbiE
MEIRLAAQSFAIKISMPRRERMDEDLDTVRSQAEYDKLSCEERAAYVKAYYDKMDGERVYATSPDFNLRELEIDFILSHVKGPHILDLGCGNGYTLLRIAQQVASCSLIGVDFSISLIQGARRLLEKQTAQLSSIPVFVEGDATTYTPPTGDGSLDTVITERFLLNLPTDSLQHAVIRRIHAMLKRDGVYIMIEGSVDGLDRLNAVRRMAGLDPILDRDSHNLSSRKFDDEQITAFLGDYFTIQEVKTFDLYYLISRVVYPKLIGLEKPCYDHPVNTLARELTKMMNYPSRGIGHVKGYLLVKRF